MRTGRTGALPSSTREVRTGTTGVRAAVTGSRAERGHAASREQVEARLLERYPELAAGLVVATVGLVRRRRLRDPQAVATWPEVEAAAEERLLLQVAMRGRPAGRRRRLR